MHILLDKAKKYTPDSSVLTHEGYEFGREGYCASVEDGSPMVANKDLASLSTKKADVETGEDQKGE